MNKIKLLSLLAILFSFNFVRAQVCPGSDEVEAKVSFIYNEKVKVFVCGFEEIGTKPPKGKRQLNDFSVYVSGIESKPSKVFSVGALENYWVGKEEKNGIIFEELLWLAGRLQPFLKSRVICSDSACSRSEPICVLPRQKSKTPDIVRQIDKKLRSKITRIQLPLSDMVELTFVEALAGNQKATAFFADAEWPNRLDPNAMQSYVASQKALERVKLANCWPKPRKKR